MGPPIPRGEAKRVGRRVFLSFASVLKLWPLFPGFLPAFWFLHGRGIEVVAMGVFTAIMIAALVRVGSSERRYLIGVAAGTALFFSVPSVVIAYYVFRA